MRLSNCLLPLFLGATALSISVQGTPLNRERSVVGNTQPIQRAAEAEGGEFVERVHRKTTLGLGLNLKTVAVESNTTIYVPSKAYICAKCSECADRSVEPCLTHCKGCPDQVIIGAGVSVSTQVDGETIVFVDSNQVAITQELNVAGTINGYDGLNIEGPTAVQQLTAGATSVQSLNSAGPISGAGGLTISAGVTDVQDFYAVDTQLQSLNVTGITNVAELNAGGPVSANDGLVVTHGDTTLQDVSAVGATFQTLDVTGVSNVAALNAGGLISGTAGLTITQGATTVQDLIVEGGAAVNGNGGLRVTNGPTSVQSLEADGFFALTFQQQQLVLLNTQGANFVGPMQIDTNLNVDGLSTLESVLVHQGVTVQNGGLRVLEGGLTVASGNTLLDEVVASSAQITGPVGLSVVSGPLNVIGGLARLQSGVEIDDGLVVRTGVARFEGGIDVNRISLTGDLIIDSAGGKLVATFAEIGDLLVKDSFESKAGLLVSQGLVSVTSAEGLNVNGPTTLRDLTVTGTTSITSASALLVNGQGGAIITGPTNLQGPLTVSETAIFSAPVSMTDLVVTSNLQFNSANTMMVGGNGGMSVLGKTTLIGPLELSAPTTATAPVTIATSSNSPALTVGGSGSLLVSAIGGLTVSNGVTRVRGMSATALDVSGSTRLQATSACGPVAMNGALNVNGLFSFDDTSSDFPVGAAIVGSNTCTAAEEGNMKLATYQGRLFIAVCVGNGADSYGWRFLGGQQTIDNSCSINPVVNDFNGGILDPLFPNIN